MVTNVKKEFPRIFAGLLALIMVLALIPAGTIFNASAAVTSSFQVDLPAGIDASVKITNTKDSEDYREISSKNSTAVFSDYIDSEKTYSIEFSKMQNYKNFSDTIDSSKNNYALLQTSLVEKDEQSITFEATAITKTIGDEAFVNTITNQGDGNGTLSFESSNESVATVANDGTVTMLSLGSTTITVKKSTDDNYKAATASYTLNVGKIKNYLSFSNNATELTFTYGDENVGPYAIHTEDYIGNITYQIGDNSIAEIDSSTGKLTLKKSGETTVTATAEANGNYEEATAQYKLIVNKKEINITCDFHKYYGEADPESFSEEQTKNIKNTIKENIVEDNKDLVCNQLFGLINTPISFSGETSGEYRDVNEYTVNYSVNDDSCYKLNISGKLSVEMASATDTDKNYKIEGLNNDKWGKEVTISANEGYIVSKKSNDNWSANVTYNTSSANEEKVFYIRENKDDGTKVKVIKCTEVFGVDATNPSIESFEIKKTNNSVIEKALHFLTFGFFFNEQVSIVVNVADEGNSSGLKEVTLYAGKENLGTVHVVDGQGTFNIPADGITDETEEGTKAFESAICAEVKDKVGNTSGQVQATTDNSDLSGSTLMIETKKPEIKVTRDNANYTKSSGDSSKTEWFSDNVKYGVSIKDEDSGISSVKAEINGIELENSIDEQKQNISQEFYKNDTKKTSFDFTISTEQAKKEGAEVINADGSYDVKITVTDNAGNVSEYEDEIYKDTFAPQITEFDFGKNAEDYVNETIYGFYFSKDTEVKISASDENVEFPSYIKSGVKSIFVYLYDVEKETYYTIQKEDNNICVVELENCKSVENAEKSAKSIDSESGKISFVIPANFKGQIYAKATDNVGNIAENYSNPKPNGVILETQEQHNAYDADHITFSKEDAPYKTNEGKDLYDDDVEVEVTVRDNYNGIGSVEWSIKSPSDTENKPSESVSINNKKELVVKNESDDNSEWTLKENKVDNLVYEMSRTITVTNDSNDIKLYVKMTDRAGNVSEKTLTLNIDKTAPVVDVQMDDSISGGYKAFFNHDKTAIITVKERNFISNGHFTASITDDKGKTKKIEIEPKFNLITDKNGKPVSDKNNDIEFYTYEMTYTFVNDGDYIFSVDEIVDIVGHDFDPDNGITYSNIRSNAVSVEDGFKGITFTIDHTRPEVTVKYDNNSAENGNYYKANRTATINIKEHNFNSDDVVISIISTDNATGTEVSTVSPKASEWKKTGNNIYTATISYTNDSKYVFDIEYIDMAGNSIKDYSPETFYIDKTVPTLEITNVGDRTANNGVVAPAIHMFDTNFNKDKVTINLSGVNNGKVNYSNSTEEITNGQNISYQDFDHVQSVDDIYTLAVKLTDMAGNESEKTIVFSANRYGSVYDISTLKQIIGKYLQKEKDIVFTETNVDNLDPDTIKIKLTKNGTPKDLVLDKDYTINKIEQKWATWSQYTYTIKKELFANDGTYSISIFSKDAAGNVNENIEETKKAEISFGIDKTKPVVVPIDFESGVQYALNGKKVSIEIKDNLVLENVKIYLNGKEIEYKVEGETYSFEVPESNTKQTVRVVVTDAAGNTEELLVEKFLVSTNIFVRWYNNTPLFVGTIAGIVLIAGAVAFIVLRKRKSA